MNDCSYTKISKDTIMNNRSYIFSSPS